MISVKPCGDNTFSYILESLDKATGKRKRIVQKGFTSKEEAMKAAKVKELQSHEFSNDEK
ncbi:Arm DNA-binding domain-containing protein [Bacillus safensis]|uniref:Arm DNA-binding domain-containing protein n=1 Tax=Bacillus safensis TaxID=561879 RepID=UPI002452D04C|nr:Arm DNA-binding domain-containing protein [Bacillus safensis]MDH3097550.1 Arm DNA-binding domain-containing protein [Bacillus safensis]